MDVIHRKKHGIQFAAAVTLVTISNDEGGAEFSKTGLHAEFMDGLIAIIPPLLEFRTMLEVLWILLFPTLVGRTTLCLEFRKRHWIRLDTLEFLLFLEALSFTKALP